MTVRDTRATAPQALRMAALLRYGDGAASTRQRLDLYLPDLSQANIVVDRHVLLDNAYVTQLDNRSVAKYRAAASGYLKRLHAVRRLVDYDVIWIYGEAFPFLPARIERALLPAAVPTIVDFDDAIFLNYATSANPGVRRLLGRKHQTLFARVDRCAVGNAYLADFAEQYSPVTILPTVIDTKVVIPSCGPSPDTPPAIGWIGSPSTVRYLEPLIPLLQTLVQKGLARVVLVGAGDRFRGIAEFEQHGWALDAELPLLHRFEIGIMPLPADPWAEGKCGYKLIQYAGVGIPAIASPVGVNRDIVIEGVTGLLASSTEEWGAACQRLLSDPGLRRKMGLAARSHVIANYSLSAHAPRFVAMVREVAGGSRDPGSSRAFAKIHRHSSL